MVADRHDGSSRDHACRELPNVPVPPAWLLHGCCAADDSRHGEGGREGGRESLLWKSQRFELWSDGDVWVCGDLRPSP